MTSLRRARRCGEAMSFCRWRRARLCRGLLAAWILGVAACTPAREQNIDRVAAYYVDKLNDTLATGGPEAGASTMEKPVIDSLTRGWTEENWQHFWEEVERLRAH